MGIDLIAYLMILGTVFALCYQWLGWVLFAIILIGTLVLLIIPPEEIDLSHLEDDED